ncbi:MAG: YHS domain-containing (seleno)protein [Devosia sp.]
MLKRTLLAAAASIALTTGVFAGPQYVNDTGFANSGYDVVAYFDMEQAPVGSPQPAAVPGSAAFTAEHNGATFAFANADNLAKFQANPDKYAPQFDGHCAYGVAKGGKVPGNPNLWRIVDDKLYLNITPNVVTFWEEDISGNLVTAGSNWAGIEEDPASDMAIPKFDTGAAPKS